MLSIDFTNVLADAVGADNGITKEDAATLISRTTAAHEQLEKWRASGDALFYDIVDEDCLLSGIPEKAAEVSERFDNVVVLGIGGSALGLRAASQALLPSHWNLRTKESREGRPRLFVCDNIDPESFSGLLGLIDIEKTCFTIISKSGRTTETAAQLLVVLDHLKALLGENWHENVVIITDPEAGELRPMVRELGLTAFSIPPKLGGRFSVLSPVGLFPAACVGIDVEELVNGARAMASRCSEPSLETNPGYHIGAAFYQFDTAKRKNMSVMFSYSDALMLTADWYAQLWAESLGKSGRGQTPVRAVGTTDQHSQVQLYMEGPADKVFTFVGVEKFRTPAEATRISDAPKAFSYLNGHDLGSILRAEQVATSRALTEMGRPNMTVTFPQIDAHHLGEFFMLYEVATAFAGALYEIDPFNQPGVELGKKLTREILQR